MLTGGNVKVKEPNLPVHFQSDCPVDDGEAEHSDPAEQNTPERTRLKVHYEHLQTQRETHPL